LGVIETRKSVVRSPLECQESGGRIGGTPDVPSEEQVQQARIATARRQPQWTEIDKSELERRGRDYVHSETGQLYAEHRAPVFDRYSASIISVQAAKLTFYVTDDGAIRFFERESDAIGGQRA
jgi:hypothetical protein